MFFMFGIYSDKKELNHTQTTICEACGSYGRFDVFMTYTVLSLFLIPCFKWNKHYYVQMSCCGTLYELDADIGKTIASGEYVEIKQEHLTKINQGYKNIHKHCANCGYETDEDFEYCPKCGTKF